MHCFIDSGFELDFATAAIACVLGENGDAAGVVDAVGNGVGCESPEDDRMHRADARASQQGNGEFRCHAHVDGDAVTLLDAQVFEGRGKLLHFVEKLGVGEAAHLARLAFPDDGCLLRSLAQRVPVDAVIAEVGSTADEPLGPGEIPIKNLVPGFEPMELTGCTGPELFRILNGLPVKRFVFLKALDVRLGAKLRGRRKDAVFTQCGINILTGKGGHRQGRHDNVLLGKRDDCGQRRLGRRSPGKNPRGCHFNGRAHTRQVT